MAQAVPALPRSLLPQTSRDVIYTLCRGFQVALPHGLSFEGVSAMIARQFPLDALGDLAGGFQQGGVLKMRQTSLAPAVLSLVRLWD